MPPLARRLLPWALTLAAVVGLFFALRPPLEVHRTFESPHGRYRVVVLRRPSLLAMMPGQGSDASGVVRLQDAAGRTLHEVSLDGRSVSSIDQLTWSRDMVDVKLLVDWPLSPPDE